MLNIDNIKSMVSKRGGLASANRFNVIFRPPESALINLDQGSLESLGAALLSGAGSIRSLINDPRDLTLMCESTTLPGRLISTYDSYMGKQTTKFPSTFIDGSVTMTFMLTNDYYVKRIFESWLQAVFNVDKYQVGYKKDYSTDIIIQHLNQKNIPIYGVKLEKAFPVSISEVQLSNSSGNEYAKISVTFEFDKFTSEGPLSSTGSAIREIIPQNIVGPQSII
jgi:hypothetical protein